MALALRVDGPKQKQVSRTITGLPASSLTSHYLLKHHGYLIPVDNPADFPYPFPQVRVAVGGIINLP